jgi:proteasome component ECM29
MLISGDAYSFFGQVMEILSHINKRVKHRPEIPLPMLDLWNIYTGSTSSTIVRNFCIVYIEMAFERLPTEVFLFCFVLLITNFLKNCFNIPAKVNRTSLPSRITGERKHCT